MSLAGRGAVVTGGGRGIGAAVARALAGDGARVLIAARHIDEVEAVAVELRRAGHEAWAAHCDVTNAGQVAALAHYGPEIASAAADILVNNAGTASSAPVQRIMLEEWQRLLAVNATGTLARDPGVPAGHARAHWGRIVNVASIAGLAGGKYIAAYSAAKHAVIGFTRSVAAELAGTGVTVNAVCPGYVDTPMTDDSLARIMERTKQTREAALAAVLSHSGQPRLVTADEVAATVLALAGDEAATLNGQTIVLDAGALRA